MRTVGKGRTVGRKKSKSKKHRRKQKKRILWLADQTAHYTTKSEQAEIEEVWKSLVRRGVIV
jgi:hypothetical protein